MMSVSINDIMISPVDNPLASLATSSHRKDIDIEIVGVYCSSFGRSYTLSTVVRKCPTYYTGLDGIAPLQFFWLLCIDQSITNRIQERR
jgi:hypothetical protein